MSTTTTRPKASSVEAALLARLGLLPAASSQDVETAHDELVEFLEEAPADLRVWARTQIGAIDEAYALLSDPTIDRSTLSAVEASAIVAPASKPTVVPAAERAEPIGDDDVDAMIEDQPKHPKARRSTRRSSQAAARRDPVGGPLGAGEVRLVRRLALVAAVMVGVVAVAIVGYNLNGGTGVPPVNGSPDAGAAASPAIDTVKVAELMQKIQADPKDTASLQSLADIYYLAGDFETAGGFLEKVLTVDSNNVTARLALGAALFNLGKSDGAETQWRQVLAIEPDNLEAHYDLGFMYLSATPPDIANVKLEWNKVIAIAPGSDVAKTVATHLATLEASPAPGASGAPASAAPAASAAPSASAGPSASPVASPAASGS